MENKIKNNELVVKLKDLVRTERKITAEIVESIKEIDRARLYLDYGYTSMFSFLTKEIGYTPAAAQRRIDAARLSNEIPELKEDLKSEAINLSQVSMMAQAVRQKQKEQPEITVTTNMKKELLEQIQSMDLIATEKVLAENLDLSIQVHEKKHHQKDNSVRIELTLSQQQMALLERVKELISHQNPNPTMVELIEFLAMSYLKAKDPLMKKPKVSTDAKKVSIDVVKANKVKQEIFQRDQCCQWKDLGTDQICGSKFQLQIDHKDPLWQGGSNNKENLQVLCSIHNQLKYQMEIGA